MGTVMVNEAPLASLTTSNSVPEVKCAQNVMGLKMTEDVRKLAAFLVREVFTSFRRDCPHCVLCELTIISP